MTLRHQNSPADDVIARPDDVTGTEAAAKPLTSETEDEGYNTVHESTVKLPV